MNALWLKHMQDDVRMVWAPVATKVVALCPWRGTEAASRSITGDRGGKAGGGNQECTALHLNCLQECIRRYHPSSTPKQCVSRSKSDTAE